MKHKAGDEVTIRKDLDTDKLYHMLPSGVSAWVIPTMLQYAGKKATIIQADSIHGYTLDIDTKDNHKHGWVDEMFEEEKPKTTIRDSLIVDIDRIILKLRGLLDNEESGTRRAVIEEIIADMKINKNLL